MQKVSRPKQVPMDLAVALITAIKKREVLYNTHHQDYKSRNKMELAWKEVSDEVGCDVKYCRSTWAQWRATYNRILSQQKTHGQNPPKWYLYHLMTFAKEFMAHGGEPDTPPWTPNQLDISLSTDTKPTQPGVYPLTSEQLNFPLVSDIKPPQPHVHPFILTQSTQPQTQGLSLTQTEFPCLMLSEPSAIDSQKALPLLEEGTSFSAIASASEESQSSEQVTPAKKSEKRKICMESDPSHEPCSALQQSRKEKSEQEDPDLTFLKGLLPMIKQMTPRNKRKFFQQTLNSCSIILDNQE